MLFFTRPFIYFFGFSGMFSFQVAAFGLAKLKIGCSALCVVEGLRFIIDSFIMLFQS